MTVVAANAIDKRGETRRIELYFEERTPTAANVKCGRIPWGVGVTFGFARRLGIGVWVTQRHPKPRCDREFEPVGHIASRGGHRRRGGGIEWQLLVPCHVIAGARDVRQEADTWLIMANVVAVVREARWLTIVERVNVGTGCVVSSWPLDRAEAIAVERTDGIWRDAATCSGGADDTRASQLRLQKHSKEEKDDKWGNYPDAVTSGDPYKGNATAHTRTSKTLRIQRPRVGTHMEREWTR